MRFAAILLAAGLLAQPALGQDPGDERERVRVRSCRTLANQIARYEGDAAMARERGNELWEQASYQQIARLEERRRTHGCPEYAKSNGVALRFASFLGSAARTALQYLTFGQ